jgi:predicted nucleotidyltransferase
MDNINTYLTRLSKQISSSTDERERIDKSFNYLEGKIYEHFRGRIDTVSLFGSYSRGTELSQLVDPNSDVDVLVVFKTNEYQPDTFLKHLQEFADKIYSRSEVSPDHPAITIILNHAKFELVPAYWERNIFSSDELKIPAPRNKELKWVTTKPLELKRAVLEKDTAENQLIIPTIKLVKYFNSKRGKPYESFRIEAQAIDTRYNKGELKGYLLKFINDLFTTGQTELQIKLINELKSHREKLLILENGDMQDYALQELQKFLPPINIA